MTKDLFFKLMFLQAIVLQVLDGTFTYWGVANFGIAIEGNPFVAMMIEQYGLIQGLIMTKLGGILSVSFLYKISLNEVSSFIPRSGIVFLNVVYSIVVGIWFLVWIEPEKFGLF